MTDVRQQGAATVGGPPINYYVRPKNGGTDWDLGPTNPPGNGKAPIVFRRGDPEADIRIHLVQGGPGIRFNTGDPVWIEENGSCPPQPGNNCPDQIDDVQCTDTMLTMHNTNSRACSIRYQMNFVGAAPCDPEIRNGGTT